MTETAQKKPRPHKTLSDFDFTTISDEHLALMAKGVEDMLEVLEQAARENYHVLTNVLATKEDTPFTQWQHYPPRDVRDPDTGSQYFYHAHEEDLLARPWEEHGHFHLFLYSEHVTSLENAPEPIALPPEPDMENGGLCHLLAVSFDMQGLPIQMFTVNRWVAAEWMYPAETLIPLIDRFEIKNAINGRETLDLTSRWLTALLKIYRPQIEWALRERDIMLVELAQSHPDNYTELDEVEVLSAVAFDLANQIDRIEQEQERRA